MRDTPTIEFLAFCLQQAPGVGAVTLHSVLARIARERLTPESFMELDDQAWQTRFGLKPPAIAALRRPDRETTDTWQRLHAGSVKILVLGQPAYPSRLAAFLREAAPPILFVLGNLEIFHLPAVGFCGSRKASEKGLRVAHDCAFHLAQNKINVVSGYAHGVDLAAHEAALQAGGTTSLVLAEGILHFRVKEQLRDLLPEGDFSRILVVSEFSPGLTWKAHNAMTRNRTICGLANAMIVIESGLEGGTFEAGKTALDLGEPLFCVEYAEPSSSAAGNPYFLQHGAFSLKRSRAGPPNLSQVLSIVRHGGGPIPRAHHQENLLLREEHKP